MFHKLLDLRYLVKKLTRRLEIKIMGKSDIEIAVLRHRKARIKELHHMEIGSVNDLSG